MKKRDRKWLAGVPAAVAECSVHIATNNKASSGLLLASHAMTMLQAQQRSMQQDL